MGDLKVIFMDAGQGDCTLIVYPDNSLTLVDCGSTKSGTEAFEQIQIVLNRYLPRNRQPNHIDNLVLTHPDADHYNLLRALLGTRPRPTIGHVYYGGDIGLYKNKQEKCFTFNYLSKHRNAGAPANSFNTVPDRNLSRGRVNVYVLAVNATGNPGGRTGAIKNSNSIVLMVEVPDVAKLFLMGDAFQSTEGNILDAVGLVTAPPSRKRKRNPVGDVLAPGSLEIVLKMGHHGSDTSTGERWVKRIKPNILFVSSGTKTFSRKGMPTKTHIADTIRHGSIITNTGVAPQSYVVFDPNLRRGRNFVNQSPTAEGIWTTCYHAEWVDDRWVESGQSWYYVVENADGREPKAKPPERWVGYTGYEETEDEDEDD